MNDRRRALYGLVAALVGGLLGGPLMAAAYNRDMDPTSPAWFGPIGFLLLVAGGAIALLLAAGVDNADELNESPADEPT